jgi:hypothetical protein
MVNRALSWLERKNFISVHAMTLYVTVWMTWRAFLWAGEYAFATTLDGIGTAAVIAAVTAPISAMQVFVFKTYSESRK